MQNKDEQLTYEELTALCKRQEEYIKEHEKDSELLDISYKHRLSWFRLEMCRTVKEFNSIYQDIPTLKKKILTEDEFNKIKEYQMNKEKEKNENK